MGSKQVNQVKMSENRSIEVGLLRKWGGKIKELDNYLCKNCGSSRYLVAHHIYPKKDYPEMKYDLKNGVSLCVNCHYDLHGFKRLTEAGLRMSFPWEFDMDGNELNNWREISEKERLENKKIYYQDNKEEIGKKNKAYREKYPERIKIMYKIAGKRWRDNHPVENKRWMRLSEKRRKAKKKNDPVYRKKENKRQMDNYYYNMLNKPGYATKRKIKNKQGMKIWRNRKGFCKIIKSGIISLDRPNYRTKANLQREIKKQKIKLNLI